MNHSVSDNVKEQAHTNGMESFWTVPKRGLKGTFHHTSPQHLLRYTNEFAGRHNICDLGTLAQVTALTQGIVRKRLKYKEVVARRKVGFRARSQCTTVGFMRILREQILEHACETNKHHKPDKVFSISGDANPEFRIGRKLKGHDEIDAFVQINADDEDSALATFHDRNYRNPLSEHNLDTVNLAWSDEDDTCNATI